MLSSTSALRKLVSQVFQGLLFTSCHKLREYAVVYSQQYHAEHRTIIELSKDFPQDVSKTSTILHLQNLQNLKL
jgi:hypothetical protein